MYNLLAMSQNRICGRTEVGVENYPFRQLCRRRKDPVAGSAWPHGGFYLNPDSSLSIFRSIKICNPCDLEIPPRFEILAAMSPRFSELNKVEVMSPTSERWEGYVIASQFRDGRWMYKISMTEDPQKSKSFDCWFPEEWLQATK